MDTVYITGHRNPDTDSIVSAMAYAALKNALGQRQYRAARLGQISDETKAVLQKFDAQPPGSSFTTSAHRCGTLCTIRPLPSPPPPPSAGHGR